MPTYIDPTDGLDLYDGRAAQRGNPSFVWRAGQDRRLNMILQWGNVPPAGRLPRVLVDGCGVGMYVKALRPYADVICGLDIEPVHLARAAEVVPDAKLQLAACENLPYPDDYFDLLLSHEVLEHVQNDFAAAAEIARVLRPGGRAIVFVPNRLYPFETHGHYWRGAYHFGNTPLINYLPNILRNRFAPHVRVYTQAGLLELFYGQPVRVVQLAQIYPGYDNLVARKPALGRAMRAFTYMLERTPLTRFGISHLLVIEKGT